VWKLQEAILGFTRLNNAHHGVRLGQAMFKITELLQIHDRVPFYVDYSVFQLIPFTQIFYATCDNAVNNNTMLVEFARLIKVATGKIWDPIERRIGSVFLLLLLFNLHFCLQLSRACN
jgi:hypothetical protein